MFDSDDAVVWESNYAGKTEDHSPEYWHGMAREARSIADGLATETNRRQMLAVAANYERLADEVGAERTFSATHAPWS